MNVGMVLIWALVVIGVVIVICYLGRADRRPGSRSIGPRPAEQVLAERFGRGEIDEDEYRRRLGALHGTARPGTAPRADHREPS